MHTIRILVNRLKSINAGYPAGAYNSSITTARSAHQPHRLHRRSTCRRASGCRDTRAAEPTDTGGRYSTRGSIRTLTVTTATARQKLTSHSDQSRLHSQHQKLPATRSQLTTPRRSIKLVTGAPDSSVHHSKTTFVECLSRSNSNPGRHTRVRSIRVPLSD